MLRTILSVLGVVFIGLGLFGGNMLSKFFNNVTDQSSQLASVSAPGVNNTASVAASVIETPVVAASGVGEPGIGDSGVVQLEVAESADTPVAVIEEVAMQEVETIEDVLPNSLVDSSSTIVTQGTGAAEELVENTVVTQVIPEATVIAEPVDAVIVSAIVADSVEVAEPMAPAQAAGDLVAMAEQAKSSGRNEQVNLAKTILASSKPLAAEPVVVKSEEVESVMVSTTGEISNDMLVVVKDKVNLRDGPSIDHPIVLQLAQGQELMEFKREGKWIHVGAYGTSGKIGWVHQRLVGPTSN